MPRSPSAPYRVDIFQPCSLFSKLEDQRHQRFQLLAQPRIEDGAQHRQVADVEMWVELFVTDLFWQKNEYFLSGLEKQPLFNSQGEPISHDLFVQKIKKVWENLSPDMHASVEPIATQVNGEEATVTAVITWPHHQRQKQVNSSFRLQISAFYGWDIVQTSLLDDLLAALR